MCKIIDRLRTGQTPEERSGVIWHTQGSGKSLTMVFVDPQAAHVRRPEGLQGCLINDRNDLEKQLGETAALTGEKVTYIASSEDLKRSWQGIGFQPEHGDDPQVPGEPEPRLARYLEDVLGDLPDVRSRSAS